jgi:hypothetical protein
MDRPEISLASLIHSPTWPRTFQTFVARLDALQARVEHRVEELGYTVNDETLASVRWAMHHVCLSPDGQSLFLEHGGAFETFDAEQYTWQADLCAAVSVDFADEIEALRAILDDALRDAMIQRVAAAGFAEMRAKDPEWFEAILQQVPPAEFINVMIRSLIRGQFWSGGPWVTLTPMERRAAEDLMGEA